MSRKIINKENHSPIIKFRVDSEVKDILDELKAQDENISKFIRESIKGNSITKKFSQFFINPEVASNIPDEPKKLFLESLTPQEKEIIDSILEVV